MIAILSHQKFWTHQYNKILNFKNVLQLENLNQTHSSMGGDSNIANTHKYKNESENNNNF